MPRVLDPKINEHAREWQEKRELAERIAKQELRQTITDKKTLRLIVSQVVRTRFKRTLEIIDGELKQNSSDIDYLTRRLFNVFDNIAEDIAFHTNSDLKTIKLLVGESGKNILHRFAFDKLSKIYDIVRTKFGKQFFDDFKLDLTPIKNDFSNATLELAKMGLTSEKKQIDRFFKNAYLDPIDSFKWGLLGAPDFMNFFMTLKKIYILEELLQKSDYNSFAKALRKLQNDIGTKGVYISNSRSYKIITPDYPQLQIAIHEYIHFVLENHNLDQTHDETFVHAFTNYIILRLGFPEINYSEFENTIIRNGNRIGKAIFYANKDNILTFEEFYKQYLLEIDKLRDEKFRASTLILNRFNDF